ncbi:MAG: LysM peptidoglycan-binding domain-containing protein [Spartobacteria bacterium]|nr:LysM peptidoglycan-binding domain-containing protein [Spartobacteria bacterium]
MKYFLRYTVVIMIAWSVLTTCGCGNKVARMEKSEENHPAMKKARIRKNAQDIDGAIRIYNDLLEREPKIVRAHLELALLYDEYKEDYVRAIYHYQRYAEKRPAADKQEMVDGLIRKARIHYAASLPDMPSGAVEEIALMKEENEALKDRIVALMEVIHRDGGVSGTGAPPLEPKVEAALASVQSGDQTTVESLKKPKPKPAERAVGSYKVAKGDTLSRISKKVYGDPSRWREIYDANKREMKSPSSLTVGQTLVIPH